jgi:hypothetical protein
VDPVPGERSRDAERGHVEETPRLWVFLLTLAVLISVGFQTVQLVRDHGSLRALRASQEPTIQQARAVRAQLDSIARRTLELAQQGNSGAATIVEQLAKRGITISPGPTPAAAPAPEK